MMMRAALGYAEFLGLAVFPVAANCRSPLVARGCHAASKDPDQIRRWFSSGSPNLACATGSPSGVWVLDIDVKGAINGFDAVQALEALHGPLPETWTTCTPSGGEHRWFASNDRVASNRVGFQPGLDVRTTGGSVALPPSRRTDGSYGWLIDPADRELARAPGWLIELIDPPVGLRPGPAPLKITSYERTASYVVSAVNAECGELAGCGRGGRNARLFRAAASLGQFVGAGLLGEDSAWTALERAAQECGLTKDDGVHAVRASIRSGMERGKSNPREIAQ